MRKLTDAACSSAASCASAVYQRVDQPPQTTPSGNELNEYTRRMTIGRKRKAMPRTSAVILKADNRRMSAALHAAQRLILKNNDRRDQQAYQHDGHRRGGRPVLVGEE